MSNLKTVLKTCKYCGTEFYGVKKSIFCSAKCKNDLLAITNREKRFEENNLKYENADPNSYVTCAICGFKGNSISCHVKIHNITNNDYKEKYGPVVSNDYISGLTGENNASYKGDNKDNLYNRNKAKYENADPNSYVTCAICDFKSSNIGHHIHTHAISTEDYKNQYGPVVCKDSVDKVTGENNPGYNHGGKLSPFSKNFVKYQDLTEEEKENTIAQKYEDNSKFMEENPHRNPTRIEYYLAQGLSEEDAQKALSKRQSTFSLKICQEKHGKEVGKRIWEERQTKWLNVLDSKTDEEKDEISRKKGINRNCLDLFLEGSDAPGSLYLIKISDNQYKIGITSRSLEKRYSSEIYDKYQVIYNETDTISHVFMVEQILKDNYKRYVRRKEYGDFGEFGWTEVFNDIDLEPLIEEIELYMNNKELTTNKFQEIYI